MKRKTTPSPVQFPVVYKLYTIDQTVGGQVFIKRDNTHIGYAASEKDARDIIDMLTAEKNPAPRIGTRRPRRRSQITGRAPTKRLVKRRTVNTRKGFFPNPAQLEATHYARNPKRRAKHKATSGKYRVQVLTKSDWNTIDTCQSLEHAKRLAKTVGAFTSKPVRVVK